MINFLANIPLYIGLVFNSIGKLFINISFNLHMKFKTEIGVKLIEVEKATKELLTTLSQSKQQEIDNSDRKLVNILNGSN